MNALDVLAAAFRRLDQPGDGTLRLDQPAVREWPEGLVDKLIASGLLNRGPAATSLVCDACLEAHTERVEFWENQGEVKPFIACPSAGRLWLEPGQLNTWRADARATAEGLARLASSPRRPDEVVTGRAWRLAPPNSLSEQQPLYVVRGAGWADSDELLNRLPRERKFFLLFAPVIPARWNTQDETLPLIECITLTPHLRLDFSSFLTPPVEHRHAILRRGRLWQIAYDSPLQAVRHMLGLRYLALLVSHPGTEFTAIEMATRQSADLPAEQLEDGMSIDAGFDNYALADEVAIRQTRAKIAELTRKKSSVGLDDDEASELEVLRAYLGSVTKLGGNPRRMAGRGEAARSSVTGAIQRAISEVRIVLPAMAEHFDSSIKTGGRCSYQPKEPIVWAVEENGS